MEGVGLGVGEHLVHLLLESQYLLPQFVGLLGVAHVLLAGLHQFLVLAHQEPVVLLQDADLLLVVVVHLHADVLAAVQHVLVTLEDLQLHLQFVAASLGS